MQTYSNPARESDPHALPDVEVFHHTHAKREHCALNADHKAELYGECILNDEGDCFGSGWFYHFCFPGCLPDSEPCGPFATQAEAIADAQSNASDDASDDAEQDNNAIAIGDLPVPRRLRDAQWID